MNTKAQTTISGIILSLLAFSATAFAALPGAPVIGVPVASNTKVVVNFTAPASNGGKAITGYTATSTPGSITATATASPITVTGLTNNTAYTFKVKATNADGTGAESAASISVTPNPQAGGNPTVWESGNLCAIGPTLPQIISDSAGNVFVTQTCATSGAAAPDMPTGGGLLVAKYNASGSMLWHTWLGGGSSYPRVSGMALDSSGDLYLTGSQYGNSWGAPLSPAPVPPNYGMFAAKVTGSGSLAWNTFFGAYSGNVSTSGGIAVSNGSVYVTGGSAASWGAPATAYSCGSGTALFLARFNASSGVEDWHTFPNGCIQAGSVSVPPSITISAAGNPVVAGVTSTGWGAPINAFSGSCSENAFLAEFDKNSAATVKNTFHCQSNPANRIVINGITTDPSGNIIATGYSGNWQTGVTVNKFQLTTDSGIITNDDTFVAKFAPDLSLTWNSFMGGDYNAAPGYFYGRLPAIDPAGFIHSFGYGTVNNIYGPASAGGLSFPSGNAVLLQFNSEGYKTTSTPLFNKATVTGIAAPFTDSIYVAYLNSASLSAQGSYLARRRLYPLISGTVTDSLGNPIAEATIYSSQNNVTATTDVSGQYSIKVPLGMGTTLTPAYPGASFTPATNSIADIWGDITMDFRVNSFPQQVVSSLAIDNSISPKRLFAAVKNKGVYSKLDNAASWTAATTQPTSKDIRALLVKSSALIFAGSYGNGLYKSTDSGANWSACGTNPGNLKILKLKTDSAGKIYAGTEGGVFRSDDNCATWVSVNYF